MRLNAIAPTVERVEDSTVAESKETHPAYGQICASRVSGSAVLYGSDFISQHYVSIKINRSVLNRGLSRDWPFARDELIEVSMSEAQWATFVSSMNHGSGVQCTLNYVHGEQIPPIAKRAARREQFSSELKERFKSATDEIKTMRAEIEAMKISGKAKSELIARLNTIDREITPNLKFVADQFDEHMESTVEHAKVEVASYIQAHITRAGLTSLNSEKILQLQDGKPEETK